MKFTPASINWLETLLEERFGHKFYLSPIGDSLKISLAGSPGQILFDRLRPEFHQSRSDFGCAHWNAISEGFIPNLGSFLPAPGLDDLDYPLVTHNDSSIVVHYDILGLIYWMLTRVEEIGRADLDSHGRFPALASHAYQHRYLERPIADEWMEILRQIICRQWPQLAIKQHRFTVKISHDVDSPSRYGFKDVKGLIHTIAADIVKHDKVKSAVVAPWVYLNSDKRLHPLDPENTFEWIMDQSEKFGLRSAFYFMCGRTDLANDAEYEPEHPAVRRLMRQIHERGHEIGLHPSYGTYQSSEKIIQEAIRLRQICDNEGIEQQEWGARMHFLRWKQPDTLTALDEAGLAYDSSLGYADHPGFRCGTCFEYPGFDPIADKQLKLRIRPLIAMEQTIISDLYLGLGSSERAYRKLLDLKNACRSVGGVFTLLWHNSSLSNKKLRSIYYRLLDDSH